MSAYDELAERIRTLARETVDVRAPAVERWRTVSSSPLVIELVGADDDLVLEEGDPDLEIDRAVLGDRPAPGDMLRVHRDADGWMVAGVLSTGDTD